MEKVTVKKLKIKSKCLGAQVKGNKAVLQERLRCWTEYNLDRTLFDVVSVPSLDLNSFPIVQHQPLEKLKTIAINWLSPTSIGMYFDERMARKGNEKGRRLFLCEFLKNCSFYKAGDDLYFDAMCSAEMKKSVDYEVKVHLNSRECEIMKAQCKCPAGLGPAAACKHVSALLYAIEYYAVTGNVKQNKTCTSTLQQWHRPTGSGRNLDRASVNEMMNVVTPPIYPSVEVTNYAYDAFSKGIDY